MAGPCELQLIYGVGKVWCAHSQHMKRALCRRRYAAYEAVEHPHIFGAAAALHSAASRRLQLIILVDPIVNDVRVPPILLSDFYGCPAIGDSPWPRFLSVRPIDPVPYRAWQRFLDADLFILRRAALRSLHVRHFRLVK